MYTGELAGRVPDTTNFYDAEGVGHHTSYIGLVRVTVPATRYPVPGIGSHFDTKKGIKETK